MMQEFMLKPQFSLGSGIAIILIWLMVFLSAFLGLALFISGWSVIIPYITCPAGYWQVKSFLRTRTWPDDPGASALFGKWVAVIGISFFSLILLVISISLGFLFIPLVIVPPVFISWVAVLVQITRELKVVRPKPPLVSPMADTYKDDAVKPAE
ncbi:MAG: hypothetical protein ACKO85_19455 [Isosphaeraceae bacterium]